MVEKKKTLASSNARGGAQQRELEKLNALAEAGDISEGDQRPLGFRVRHGSPEQDIGVRIQDARKQAGLTQKDLAERTKLLDDNGDGVSRGALSLYEIGKNSPPPKELRLICEALKVSPNKLIYGTEDPFDEFADRARYWFSGEHDPSTYATVVYRLSKLHYSDRVAILRFIEGRLFMENRRFEVDEDRQAEDALLRVAEAIKLKRGE